MSKILILFSVFTGIVYAPIARIFNPCPLAKVDTPVLELQKERSIIFRAKTMRWNDQHQIKITFPERL